MKNIIRYQLLFTALVGVHLISYAGQFDSAIDVIGIKTNQSNTNNGWESAEKFKGVQWKWPSSQAGGHDMQMIGKAKFGNNKNPNIGVTQIKIDGMRTMISSLNIRIQNAGENPSIKAVNSMFGPGNVKVIKTDCDDDSASNPFATFQFEKAGYKPVLIKYSASWGASGETGSVEMVLGNSLGDILGSCKAIK